MWTDTYITAQVTNKIKITDNQAFNYHKYVKVTRKIRGTFRTANRGESSQGETSFGAKRPVPGEHPYRLK
jgi:hypothetical protein